MATLEDCCPGCPGRQECESKGCYYEPDPGPEPRALPSCRKFPTLNVSKPTNRSRAVVAVLLDTSGSMMPLINTVVDGTNTFLDEQRATVAKAGGDASVDLILAAFDTDYRKLHRGVPINSDAVGPLVLADILPGGRTALHDGMGMLLADTVAFINSAGPSRPERVTVFVMTDGEENASRRWRSVEIKQVVEQLKEHGWQFIFAAANQDAVLTAADFGIERGEALSFSYNRGGAQRMEEAMLRSVKAYQTAETLHEARSEAVFTETERAESMVEEH